MRSYRVAEWMSTPPIVVAPSLSLTAAQRLMQQCRVRRLPVVQHDQLIGIVSWGDLRAAQPSTATTLSVYEWRTLLEQVAVAQCMTRELVTISPDAAVLEAAQLMLTHRLGGLPVVETGRVVGVITESDLFRLLISDASAVEDSDPTRMAVVCQHCGAVLRGRCFETVGPGDACWRCH